LKEALGDNLYERRDLVEEFTPEELFDELEMDGQCYPFEAVNFGPDADE
jgi:hypothetical protein